MSTRETTRALARLSASAVMRRMRSLVAAADADGLYLVGGALRDALLGRAVADFDFVYGGDVSALAERLARAWPARLVALNERWGLIRLVPRAGPEKEAPAVLDFAPLRGADIREDLRQRDFTVDAMAVPVTGGAGEKSGGILDPTGGMADLRDRNVRMVHPDRLREDPVRCLRAFRIACSLEGAIDPGTLEGIRSEGRRVPAAAPERIREELCKLLAFPSSHAQLSSMGEAGLLGSLFPELEPLKGLEQGTHHGLDAWDHSLEAVRALESLIRDGLRVFVPWSSELTTWVGEEKDRVCVLKLAALLHDVGKPLTATSSGSGQVHFYGHERRGGEMAAAIGTRLRMSRKDQEALAAWVGHHMWPLHLYRAASLGKLTDRARVRFFRRLGASAPGCLLLAAADQEAKGVKAAGQDAGAESFRAFVRSMLDLFYDRDAAALRVPPFVTGRDLMQAFGLRPGPQIGRLLEGIHEARVAGKVRNREEALALAGRLLGR
ncbi:MAG: HD domain-containing protein [bacterium]